MCDKIEFTRLVGELQGDCNNHGDCFHYGSFSGCDEQCPVLLRGECEVWEENIDLIADNEELIKKYKSK